MTAVKVKMGTNGRLVLPASLRKAIGLSEGSSVLIEASDGELRLRRMEDVIQSVQERLRPYLDGDASLADSLIEDRRKEAREEDAS